MRHRRAFPRRSRAAALVTLVGLPLLALWPTSAQAQDAADKPSLSVTAVDLNAGTIEITNHGEVDSDPNGIILCNFPAYAPIDGADVISAGGSIIVDSGAHGVALDPASGEIGLYTEAAYENPDAIISYVEWGDSGHKRSPVAVSAGIWAEGAVAPGTGLLSASTTRPTTPEDWSTEAEAGTTTAAGGTGELARTGTDSRTATLVAVGLVIAGAGFVLTGRRTSAV